MRARIPRYVPYPGARRLHLRLIAALSRQDLWFTRAEGAPQHAIVPTWREAETLTAELAAKRGLRTWPRGATWPSRVHPGDEGAAASSGIPAYEASTPDTANLKLAQTQESALAKQTDKQGSTEQREVPQGQPVSLRGYHHVVIVSIG